MKIWVGSLLLTVPLGFVVCFVGAATANDSLALGGFLMMAVGLFGALASIVLSEMFDF